MSPICKLVDNFSTDSEVYSKLSKLDDRGRVALYYILKNYEKTKKPTPMKAINKHVSETLDMDVSAAMGVFNQLNKYDLAEYTEYRGKSCYKPTIPKDQRVNILETLERRGVK
jgi:hypothetical protein